MRIIACYNIKGGVGKTATAVNLSYISARQGWRTLLWVLDPQAAASFYFRVEPHVKKGAKGIVRKKHALQEHIKGTNYPGLDIITGKCCNLACSSISSTGWLITPV